MALHLSLNTIVSFLVTFFTIPILIKFAEQTGLYAHRCERASHDHEVPTLGGIAIFLGMMFSTLLLCPNGEFHKIQYLLVTQFVIFFLGLKDDIFVLSARKKLLVQFLCAGTLIFFAKAKITNFYGVFGVGELSEAESVVFTLITIVGLINAMNLIDGINWLAGLISISATSFLAYWFSINGFELYAGISFTIIGAVCAFLHYNKSPARIFMGDTGSLLIGLTLSYLIIRFINLNHTTPGLAVELRSAPSLAVSLLFIPVLDTLRVIFLRLKDKRSPFSPDKNHLHHILLSTGLTHIKSSFILAGINTGVIIVSFLLNQYTGRIVVTSLFLLGFAAINFLSFRKVQKRFNIVEPNRSKAS